MRIGGEATIKTCARIVCATNVDLERAVSEGRFRRDLYYRINVIPITVPALRHRPDDILPLAHAFARAFSEAFGREAHGFTPAAEEALLAQQWPGTSASLEIASNAPWLSASRRGLVLKPSSPTKW